MDRQSTIGYCTFLGGNLITRRSKKQLVLPCSSAEAKFRAMTQGTCEILWIKIISRDLAINIAHNQVYHNRTKHVEVDRHFIKEKLDSGQVCTPYICTMNQLADVFTKGIPR